MEPATPQRTLIYEPHVVGRAGLLVGFAAATVSLLFVTPGLLDRESLPSYQQDIPQAVLVAFVALAFFVLAWNAYWFLWGCALEVRIRGASLHWQTAFHSGSIPLHEVTDIRTRFFIAPTIYSEQGSVGLFPAAGLHDLVDEIVRNSSARRPAHLGLLSLLMRSRRHTRLYVDYK